VNIVRTVARKSSNRLKFCWLKVICCICQPNELEREIQHKTGGPSRGQPKIWGAWPTQTPLEPPLGNTTTKHNQLPASIWNFNYDAKKLLQAHDCIIITSN